MSARPPGVNTANQPDLIRGSGASDEVAAAWSQVPSSVAWRFEGIGISPSHVLDLHHAVVTADLLEPETAWDAMVPFVSVALRVHGLRPGDLAGWVRAGVIVSTQARPATRLGRLSLTPEYSTWRNMAIVDPGFGWDFAVTSASAGYSPAQARTAYLSGTTSLEHLQVMAALR